jgi:hypothetical protein
MYADTHLAEIQDAIRVQNLKIQNFKQLGRCGAPRRQLKRERGFAVKMWRKTAKRNANEKAFSRAYGDIVPQLSALILQTTPLPS